MELGLGSDHYKQVFTFQNVQRTSKSHAEDTQGDFAMMRMLYTLTVVVVTKGVDMCQN